MTFNKIKFLFEHENFINIFKFKLMFAQPSLYTQDIQLPGHCVVWAEQTIKFWNVREKGQGRGKEVYDLSFCSYLIENRLILGKWVKYLADWCGWSTKERRFGVTLEEIC